MGREGGGWLSQAFPPITVRKVGRGFGGEVQEHSMASADPVTHFQQGKPSLALP